jgi:hypothetical protein
MVSIIKNNNSIWDLIYMKTTQILYITWMHRLITILVLILVFVFVHILTPFYEFSPLRPNDLTALHLQQVVDALLQQVLVGGQIDLFLLQSLHQPLMIALGGG